LNQHGFILHNSLDLGELLSSWCNVGFYFTPSIRAAISSAEPTFAEKSRSNDDDFHFWKIENFQLLLEAH